MSAHESSSAPRDYHVVLPPSGLSLEKVGLVERYSIKLIGRVDQHWEHCYERIVAASPSLRRFWLDPDTASISFPCSATDGPSEVMGTLKVLEGLLERVSRDASFLAKSGAEAQRRRGLRAKVQHWRAVRRPTLSKDRRRPDGKPSPGRERRQQGERRQQQARFFLIERRRGKAYAYRQFVLLALLAGAVLAIL